MRLRIFRTMEATIDHDLPILPRARPAGSGIGAECVSPFREASSRGASSPTPTPGSRNSTMCGSLKVSGQARFPCFQRRDSVVQAERAIY
jgi:hypothetical protein